MNSVHDEAAERHVLGAILANPQYLEEITQILDVDAFWQPRHQVIFTVMQALDAEGVKPEPIAVTAALVKAGDIGKVGHTYVADLFGQSVSWTEQAVYHARRLADLARTRRFGEYAARVGQVAASAALTATEMTDKARAWLDELGDATTGPGTLAWPDVVTRGLDAIEAAGDASGRRGIPSGLVDLDKTTGGFRPGTVTVIAGRPASGKSVLAANIAGHAAFQRGEPTLMLSLEMSAEELYMRLAAASCQIHLSRLVEGTATDTDWSRLSQHAGATATAPLWIDDTPSLALADIRVKARQHRDRHGLRLLIVDYLQLVATPRGDNRQVAVSELSRGFKLLAKELDVAIIVAAQLNRNPDQRVDKRPQPSDLRESGAIEADADLIILTHKPDLKSPRRGEADLIVGKNRHGEEKDITVAAQFQFARFMSMEAEFTAAALTASINSKKEQQ